MNGPHRAVAFLACVALAFALPSAAAPTKVTSVEGLTEYRLDNGMRLLLFPDASKPMLTVNLTILVGSRHEGYGEAGMAHLLEHMLFKGTENFPDIKQVLTEKGARWNGSTWLDRTNYFETIPASDDNLDFFIRFEADRLVRCPIRPEQLASEMTVVRNEFEIGENRPDGVLLKHMESVAFDWHNYGRDTIGNRSDIERVPADRLRAFYSRYYQPDNAILILAGRFDEARALASFEKYFGPIPRPQRKLEEPYTQEPPQDGERTVTVRRVGDVGLVGMMFHVPAGPDEQYAAVYALADVLGNTPSGRLYQSLVKTHKAASVSAWADATFDPGTLTILATVRAGESLDEVRRLMSDTLRDVADKGVTADELLRTRRRFEADRARAMMDTSRVAINLSEWAAQGDWRLYFLTRDRIEKLTAPQVQAAARQYLRESNRTVGLFIPGKEADRTPIPARPDLARMLEGYQGRPAIAAGEQLDPDPLKLEQRIQRTTLPSGLKAALLPKKSRQQEVTVRLTLRYGNEASLANQGSAPSLLPTLIRRGTARLSFQQLDDALDAAHATLSTGGGPGEVTFTLRVERPHLREGLDLLRQVVREPAFSPDEFQVIQREQIAGLEAHRTDPASLATNRIQRALSPYPTQDPRYVTTPDEEIQRLQAASAAQVAELYRAQLGASAGELSAVGDFDPNELLQAVNSILAGWKSPVEYRRLNHALKEGVARTEEVILTPDKANAAYAAGLGVALRDADPDYPALMMANTILGGSSKSRLWTRLREKEGFSYGAGSHLAADAFDPTSRLTITAAYNPLNSDKLRKAVDEEITRFLEEGPTAAELDEARSGYLRHAEMARTEDASLASQLARQLHAGRDMHFDAALIARINVLTPQDIRSAARKYIDPAKLTIITAGDFAKAHE